MKHLSKAELIDRLEACQREVGNMNNKNELQHLTQDLQVYELELEIQNRELKESQLQLEKSRDRYADLYDFAPIGYLALNPQGIVKEANLTAAFMLGVERAKLVGFPLIHYIRDADHDAYLYHLLQCKQKKNCTTELRIMTNNGEMPVSLYSITVSPQNGQSPPLYRSVLSDISERKRAEQALREAHDQLEIRVRERTHTNSPSI